MIAKAVETDGRLDGAFNSAGIEGKNGRHGRLSRRGLRSRHGDQSQKRLALHEVDRSPTFSTARSIAHQHCRPHVVGHRSFAGTIIRKAGSQMRFYGIFL